jgi:CRP/FNR family transcriptional regulator, transcriptional activator FtrB
MIDQIDVEALRGFRPFAEFAPFEYEQIRHRAEIQMIPARTHLLKIGDVPEALYVLLDGLVQLVSTSQGSDSTVLLLRPPSFFVTAAVVQNDRLLTSARTLQPSRVLHIPAACVHALLAEKGAFTRAIIDDLCVQYRNTVRELTNLRTRNGFERLIAWIAAMQARSNTPCEIRLPFDKGVLAARLGISPETLSRDLARLGALGVTVEGRTLRIAETSELRQWASCDDLTEPSLP